MDEVRSGEAHPNMDASCARHGSRIVQNKGDETKAKRLETVTRNALGVMREEGLFAFYVYLKYRWKEGGAVIWEHVRGLWKDDSVGPLITGDGDEREQVIALTGSLNDVLLAREVTERTLIYALYGLRAENAKKRT